MSYVLTKASAGHGVCALARVARMALAAFWTICLAGAFAALPSVSSAQAQEASDWQRAALGLGPKGYAAAERSKGRVPRAVAEASESEVGGKAARRSRGGKRVASLGSDTYDAVEKPKSLSGGGVRWVANSGCLDGSLKSVIYQVAANYGPITVSSTCRDHAHNRRVGGAPKSYHLSGSAADFRVHANAGAAYAFLRSSGSVGGLKHYGGGLFHIDSGPRRSF